MLKITAPREFSPFEEICTLTPFIERLSREFKDVACEGCFKRHPDLKSCKGCYDVKYCGKECQKKDWINHKLECGKLKYLPPLECSCAEANTIRILGNTILKIKGKDWKSIKSNILGMDVSFDDINTTINFLDTYRQIYYDTKEEYTRKYIGEANMPNEQDFKKIVGKVQSSVCEVSMPGRAATVRFIFEISFFSKECIPNCHYMTIKGITAFKAIKKIEKYEKLSWKTTGILQPFDAIAISAPCNCTDCSLPYGESVLSKITDKGPSLAIIRATHHFLNTWHLYRRALRMSDAIDIVNDFLSDHERVLGNTNILYLKLLAIKCFEIEDHPLEAKRNLLKLEKNYMTVFGEYDPFLIKVYFTLFKTLCEMGDDEEGLHYFEKGNFLRTSYGYSTENES